MPSRRQLPASIALTIIGVVSLVTGSLLVHAISSVDFTLAAQEEGVASTQ
jgi:hypothetical protein